MAVRVKPVGKSAKYLRVDQGVDFDQQEPYVSVGSGKVIAVSPPGSWWNPNGTGEAVYVKLDKPITVNGRTYTEVYYAEQKALVKVGQRVKAGQPVMGGGSAELGFAANGVPVGPLVGGVGAGTKATEPGYDFYDFVNGTKNSAPAGTVTPTTAQNQPLETGGNPAASPTITPPATVPPPNAPNYIGSEGPQMPGSQQYTIDPTHVVSLWQTAAAGNMVSPETSQLLSNALLVGGLSGSTNQASNT